MIVLIILYGIAAWQSYLGIKSLIPLKYLFAFNIAYGLVAIFVVAGFIYLMTQGRGVVFRQSSFHNLILGFVLAFFMTTLFHALLLGLQDLGRLLAYGYKAIGSALGSEEAVFMPERRKAITTFATIAAAVPFLGFLHGVTRGKYNYQVERVVLKFKDLPEAFHGFTMAQISDIHAGSFDSKEGVEKGVALSLIHI